MIGAQLSVEFFQNRDWPLASAVALLLLAILVLPILLFERIEHKREAAP
jgi:putrescine transport system permease protein